MTLPMIDAFSEYLTDERRFSPYTARCYGADLRQYTDFIAQQFGIEQNDAAELEAFKSTAPPKTNDVHASIGPQTITGVIRDASPDVIRNFLAHLAEQSYSAATMARKIATLRSFFKWAEKRSLVASNPMTLIRTPKQAKRLPKAISI